MNKAQSFSVLCGVCLVLAGCTASRPPSYNLPSADDVVAGDSYTVGRNENVYAIAQKQGVKLRDIIALNELKPPFALRTGQVLTLPAKDKYAAPTPKAAPIDRIDKGALAPPSNGNGGSAGLTGVQTQELPPLSATSVKSVPLDAQPAPTPALPQDHSSAASTQWKDAPQPYKDVTESPATSQPVTEPEPLTAAESPAAATAQQPEAATAQASSASTNESVPAFGWPLRGTVISGFGPKGQGLDNDGINIAAPKGSPVKASDGGMVAYAGNEMKGFGNLVLIRHEGGWVTAYAHLERLVVAKDTIVAKGDMIGTVGTTGGVSSPQLHFETRRDGKPVDPEIMMK